MRICSLLLLIACSWRCVALKEAEGQDLISPKALAIFPPDKATNINPDTHLILTFSGQPKIGTSGKIRIIDAESKKAVDTLDLSIPSSPNPSGRAPGANGSTTAPKPADPNDKTVYQKNIIAGIDFHFFPIIVRGSTATVTLHNGALKYGKKYIVTMDSLVLSGGGFSGYTEGQWTFSTKATGPSQNATKLVVAADGSGDFNTVQGKSICLVHGYGI
jgi:pectinesterase